MKSMRIVFFGTPEFAAFSLRHLLSLNYNIVAVVTAPDKPSGRGLKIQQSAVKETALTHGVPVLQPTHLKSPEFIAELASFRPDIQIVIAFRMLPEIVWSLPPLGTFNLHASKLPDYRGAAPINHAILNGETETGNTTFFIEKEIDTGKILLQSSVPIDRDDTAETLHDKLKEDGAILVQKSLELLVAKDHTLTPQVHSTNNLLAPKIFPEFCSIDFNQSAEKVRNFIRALSPYPAAKTVFKDKSFKIFSCETISDSSDVEPGTWSIHNKQLIVKCKEDAIVILELQQEGKKRMKTADFLLGFRL
jgi:methionyl-tRNA formyltransferase